MKVWIYGKMLLMGPSLLSIPLPSPKTIATTAITVIAATSLRVHRD